MLPFSEAYTRCWRIHWPLLLRIINNSPPGIDISVIPVRPWRPLPLSPSSHQRRQGGLFGGALHPILFFFLSYSSSSFFNVNNFRPLLSLPFLLSHTQLFPLPLLYFPVLSSFDLCFRILLSHLVVISLIPPCPQIHGLCLHLWFFARRLRAAAPPLQYFSRSNR